MRVKNGDIICYVLTLVSLQQPNFEELKKLIKIVDINEENLQIFLTNLGISIKFLVNICLIMILKVKKAGL